MNDYTIEVPGLTLGDGTPYGIRSVNGIVGAVPEPRTHDLDLGLEPGVAAGIDTMPRRLIMVNLLVEAATDALLVAALDALEGAWRTRKDTAAMDVQVPGWTEPRRFYGRPNGTTPNRPFGTDGDTFTADLTAVWRATDPYGYGLPVTVAVGTTDTVFVAAGREDSRRATITVTGDGGTPQVWHDESDGYLALREPLAAGQELVMDCRERTVTVDGDDRYELLVPAAVWPVVVPGNNTMRAQGVAAASIQYRPAY